MEPKFLTAKQVRARFGGISDMSLWRWLQDEQLGFPRPLIINRRRFFRLDQIEAFELRAATSSGPNATRARG
jgi:predicted DNA-binding transcriptional regulator AlpA